MDSSNKKGQKIVKTIVIIESLILIPIVLCVSCAWGIPHLINFIIDEATKPTYYKKYTEAVQEVCKECDFEIADDLEFVEGYSQLSIRDGTTYAFLFCMNDQIYHSSWETYIGEKKWQITNGIYRISPLEAEAMKETYGIEFPSSCYELDAPGVGRFCFVFLSEKQQDNQYYVYFVSF